MEAIKKFLLHILTGIDNKTFDIARVMWFITMVTFLALAIWHVVVNKSGFNALDFGGGAGGILAGGGVGVGAKSKAEPSA